MMKILLPVLILAGLILGLVLLARGRRVHVPAHVPWHRAVILLAAAAIVGAASADAGKSKPKKTCYKPATIENPFGDIHAGIDEIMMRIEALEALHEQGKLTEEVYWETLEQYRDDIWEISNNKEHVEELDEAEKKLVDLRRSMDTKLLAKLAKKPGWKKLRKQSRELEKMLAGKKNAYDQKKVAAILESLHKKGHIDGHSMTALRTTFEQISTHHERSNAMTTCYKPSLLGSQYMGFREQLTEMFTNLGGKKQSNKSFLENLDLLATATQCFVSQSEGACAIEGERDAYTRASTVTALDLLIALAK